MFYRLLFLLPNHAQTHSHTQAEWLGMIQFSKSTFLAAMGLTIIVSCSILPPYEQEEIQKKLLDDAGIEPRPAESNASVIFFQPSGSTHLLEADQATGSTYL